MDANGVNLIIDELYEMIQDARNLPLSMDKCILERDKLLDLLDELIAVLPEDIKQARTIVNSRIELVSQARQEAEALTTQAQSQASAVIASANSEADRLKSNAKAEAADIISKAKTQAQEMVTKEAIYKETEKQCKDMVDRANNKISELKTVSNKYIADSLRKAAETIESSLKDVNDTRAKFESLTGEKKPPQVSNKHFNFVDID